MLETTIDGAHSIIINFTGGHDMKIKEINEAASQVREAVSPDADIIFGAVVDENMQDDLIITIIASRFEQGAFQGRSSKLGQAQTPLSSLMCLREARRAHRDRQLMIFPIFSVRNVAVRSSL